jgi:putative Mg2+ transporter-C (MgtC) family protein
MDLAQEYSAVDKSIGRAIGCGLWQMGVIGMIGTLVTLSGVKKIQKSVRLKNFKEQKAEKSGVKD